jgi:hypothetical protein
MTPSLCLHTAPYIVGAGTTRLALSGLAMAGAALAASARGVAGVIALSHTC